MHMKKLFTNSHWIASGLLFIVVFSLAIINYRPGLVLSGWDNLHPELNCQENIKRALFSGWQEYQGLGLPAGHGHASELPRELFLCTLTSFFPQADLRYIFYCLSLLTGAFGIYFFSYALFKNKTGSLLGALFYLLHIATVQLLYAPYEAFMMYYAFLPWMIGSLFIFLNSPSWKRLFLLFLLHILGSPQFYIPTLFVVYGIILCIIFLTHIFNGKSKRAAITAAVTIFVANLYWLGLFLYYTLTNIGSQRGAHVNFLYSEDVFLKNVEFGTISDLLLFKGFMFKFTGLLDGGYGYLLKNWITHFEYTWVTYIGYFLIIIVLIGFIKGLFSKRIRVFSLLFLCFFTFLALDTPPFTLINSVLHSNSLFHQIFRNPFTKFGNALLFFEAILFVQGVLFLGSVLFPVFRRLGEVPKLLATLALIILLFAYSLPSWRGNLLYPQLFVTYPSHYQELFAFLNKQTPGRVANFPQYALDGWSTYSWGYYGSGFVWYGIQQPILDRAFDVWNLKSERYYWEISNAVYSRNIALLDTVMDKYDISWLFIDTSITGSYSSHALYLDELVELLQASEKITLEKRFGKISVYRVKKDHKTTSFVRLYDSIARSTYNPPWYWEDKMYGMKGAYTSNSTSKTPSVIGAFPFQGLFTHRNVYERDFSINDLGTYFRISSPFKNSGGGTLFLPAHNPPLEDVDTNSYLLRQYLDPILVVNSQQYSTNAAQLSNKIHLPKVDDLALLVPKIGGLYSYRLENNEELIQSSPKNCNALYNNGTLTKKVIPYLNESAIELTSIHSNNCLEIPLTQLPQNKSYILAVKSKHIQGKPLLLRITNNSSRRTELETYLSEDVAESTSYFILPPREPYGLGYTITFDNISLLHNKETINNLVDVQLFQFPYTFATNIFFSQNSEIERNEEKTSPLLEHNVIHTNPTEYLVILNTLKAASILELTQTFNVGWYAFQIDIDPRNPLLTALKMKAPYLFTKPLKHIEINDWSNGWILDETTHGNAVSILYMPQILEYLGIGVAMGYCVVFFIVRSRHKRG